MCMPSLIQAANAQITGTSPADTSSEYGPLDNRPKWGPVKTPADAFDVSAKEAFRREKDENRQADWQKHRDTLRNLVASGGKDTQAWRNFLLVPFGFKREE